MTRIRSIAILSVLAIAACSELPVTPTAPLTGMSRLASVKGDKSFVLLANGNSLPADLGASVAAAGGTLTSTMDGIGVAVATSSDPAFASKIKGVQAVEDVVLDFNPPRVADLQLNDAGSPNLTEAGVGASETFRVFQWAPDAVHAPAAWDAGYQGAGARVAIVDGGIHSTHIDIAPNLDVARSRSFVKGQPFNSDVDRVGNTCVAPSLNPPFIGFWHATHVAGIVAAPANGLGTVGIAPRATIIGVKVLHCGSGSFGALIAGIYYAATPIAELGAGANIINMSLGAAIDGRGAGIAHLLNALSRATTYANKQGVTVVAAAGNDGIDLDHTGNLVFVPAQSVGVIAVAATGPLGFGLGATNFDRPASYTNFGQSAISLAGPGGDFALPGNAACPSGSPFAGFAPCWVLDMVLAPQRGGPNSRGSYAWAAGTSMASPAVAGVAALIVGAHPGISSTGVEAILRKSADDLGKPGNDDFYGKGRVNAFRAVQ